MLITVFFWLCLSSSWNSIKGSCPYCKSKGFTHIKQKDEDPWRIFDFSEAASAAPEAAPVLEIELQDPLESELVFGQIPDQDPIENLRIQLDQELQVREEIISEIANLQIETELQRRLIMQLESQENERQIIQDLLQPSPLF